MNVKEFFATLRENWRMLVFAVIAGCVGAVVAFFIRPPEYTAETALYVSAQVGDSPQQAFQGAQLSEQRVASYTELATSDRVLTETINRLGIDSSPAVLRSKVEAVSSLDSVIIGVRATDQSPQLAAAMTNAVANVTREVVDELERPASPNGVAPVAVRVVQPAAVPIDPSSTGLPLTIALGLAVGVLVGIIAVFVRRSLDSTIASPEGLAEVAGAPNIGVIGHDDLLHESVLAVKDRPMSPQAEAYRHLRTNLQFIDVDQPRKIVLITSSLPGEGKTTTAANLSLALASMGGRVLAVEADLRRPRLADMFGLDRAVGLTSVLSGRTSLMKSVQQWGGGGLEILTSGPIPPNPNELLASRQMMNLLSELRGRYDTVVIDAPPLLPVADAAALAPLTDGALLVCRWKTTGQHAVETAAATLRNVSADVLGTVLTAVPVSGRHGYSTYSSYSSQHGGTSVLSQPIVPDANRTARIPPRPPAAEAGGNDHSSRPTRTSPGDRRETF